MKITLKFMALAVLLVIAGCAPLGPSYVSVAATLPQVPQGMARIYFYRWLEPYDSITPSEAFLNANPVGVTETGAVFYRDVPPGQYKISVQSQGVYPDQFKTVQLKPGEIAYARIESFRSWVPCGSSGGANGGGGAEGCEDTFVVVMIDPATAQQEIANLRFIAA